MICYSSVPITEGEHDAGCGRAGEARARRSGMALVQEVIQHYDGTITHGSSTELTALFSPPAAWEDHARRAILAALKSLRTWNRAWGSRGERVDADDSRV